MSLRKKILGARAFVVLMYDLIAAASKKRNSKRRWRAAGVSPEGEGEPGRITVDTDIIPIPTGTSHATGRCPPTGSRP